MKPDTQERPDTEDYKDVIRVNRKPRSGIYNDSVYVAWRDLLNKVAEFIPDHVVGAHLEGTCSDMRAKAKVIELYAKSLVEVCKATQPRRK